MLRTAPISVVINVLTSVLMTALLSVLIHVLVSVLMNVLMTAGVGLDTQMLTLNILTPFGTWSKADLNAMHRVV